MRASRASTACQRRASEMWFLRVAIELPNGRIRTLAKERYPILALKLLLRGDRCAIPGGDLVRHNRLSAQIFGRRGMRCRDDQYDGRKNHSRSHHHPQSERFTDKRPAQQDSHEWIDIGVG